MPVKKSSLKPKGTTVRKKPPTGAKKPSKAVKKLAIAEAQAGRKASEKKREAGIRSAITTQRGKAPVFQRQRRSKERTKGEVYYPGEPHGEVPWKKLAAARFAMIDDYMKRRSAHQRPTSDYHEMTFGEKGVPSPSILPRRRWGGTGFGPQSDPKMQERIARGLAAGTVGQNLEAFYPPPPKGKRIMRKGPEGRKQPTGGPRREPWPGWPGS
jgi:hypothetical protein